MLKIILILIYLLVTMGSYAQTKNGSINTDGYKNVPWKIKCAELRELLQNKGKISYEPDLSKFVIFLEKIVNKKYVDSSDFVIYTVQEEYIDTDEMDTTIYIFYQDKLLAVEVNIALDDKSIIKALKNKYTMVQHIQEKCNLNYSIPGFGEYLLDGINHQYSFKKGNNTIINFNMYEEINNDNNERINKTLERDLKKLEVNGDIVTLMNILIFIAAQSDSYASYLSYYDNDYLQEYMSNKEEEIHKQKQEEEDRKKQYLNEKL